jgi:hypothetical protein
MYLLLQFLETTATFRRKLNNHHFSTENCYTLKREQLQKCEDKEQQTLQATRMPSSSSSVKHLICAVPRTACSETGTPSGWSA